MIRRARQPARLHVYRARAASQSEPGAEQDVIDAQAEIAPERVHAVVPPGERFLVLAEHPEAVFQSQGENIPERLALPRAAQDLAFPFLWIVHVLVGGRDVVVAERRKQGGSAELFFEPASKSD